jgi:putative toxin-antitoxin system, toxin component
MKSMKGGEDMIFTPNEIKQRLQPIFISHQIRQAILFGSYGKGNATQNSDVDLLVDSDLRGLRFVGFVEELREALGDKEMDVFDITHVEPKSRIAEEIRQTGIEIYAR